MFSFFRGLFYRSTLLSQDFFHPKFHFHFKITVMEMMIRNFTESVFDDGKKKLQTPGRNWGQTSATKHR